MNTLTNEITTKDFYLAEADAEGMLPAYVYLDAATGEVWVNANRDRPAKKSLLRWSVDNLLDEYALDCIFTDVEDDALIICNGYDKEAQTFSEEAEQAMKDIEETLRNSVYQHPNYNLTDLAYHVRRKGCKHLAKATGIRLEIVKNWENMLAALTEENMLTKDLEKQVDYIEHLWTEETEEVTEKECSQFLDSAAHWLAKKGVMRTAEGLNAWTSAVNQLAHFVCGGWFYVSYYGKETDGEREVWDTPHADAEEVAVNCEELDAPGTIYDDVSERLINLLLGSAFFSGSAVAKAWQERKFETTQDGRNKISFFIEAWRECPRIYKLTARKIDDKIFTWLTYPGKKKIVVEETWVRTRNGYEWDNVLEGKPSESLYHFLHENDKATDNAIKRALEAGTEIPVHNYTQQELLRIFIAENGKGWGSIGDAAAILASSRRNLERWRTGETKLPAPVERIILLYLQADYKTRTELF